MKKYQELITRIGLSFMFCIAISLSSIQLKAQQFNSDSYITMPHGTGTFILTTGERNANMYAVFSLLPGFEFNFQTTLFWENEKTNNPQRYTTNIFGKYMFWVNEKKNGGAAVFLGVGRSPGFYTENAYSAMHKNYWTALAVTIPLFNNTISWDIMPGALVDLDYGDNKNTAWGFTWSSRINIYKIIPKTAIVGEVYGTEGQINSEPEYRVGLRWEPNDYIVPAITYGNNISGTGGAGFEIGVMIFTSQFLKKEFIKNNHIDY